VGDLGAVARELGDHAEATTRLEDALRIVRRLGERSFESHWLLNLGLVAADRGDPDLAGAHVAEALRIAIELDKQDPNLLEGAAAILAGADRYEEALKLLAAAEGKTNDLDRVRSTADQARFDAIREGCCGALGEAVAAAAWNGGTALEWRAAADVALTLLAR
jgi:tetratricopeptide (TPR) repeat protein